VAAATALLAMYPLSFGPVCWKLNGGDGWLLRAYAPLARLASDGPEFAAVPLLWYARVGIGPNKRLNLPTRINGTQRTRSRSPFWHFQRSSSQATS
jgi:hypothetical protein